MAGAFIEFYLVTNTNTTIQLLPQRTYIFGRGEDADIQIQDTLTSRHHCELRWDDQAFWSLVDLGSRNGTYCNQQRLSAPYVLGDRDALQVGGQRFVYRLLPPGSDPASLREADDSAIGSLETFEVTRSELFNEQEKPAFSGEIPRGELKKLLRFFSLTNKSGRLVLSEDNNPVNYIALVDGVPRDAAKQDIKGMAALVKLLDNPNVHFVFHEGEKLVADEWTMKDERQQLLRTVLGTTDLSDLGIDAGDLAKAERLQRHLMARLPSIPGYELGVVYEGKSGVSGDFYDVGVMPNGNVLVVLGDVAGHGVQAAMAVTGMLKTLRVLRQSDYSLPDLLVKLNEDLREDLLPGQFITLFAALLTPVTGELQVALAGHHPGLRLRLATQAQAEKFGKTGTALGVFDSEQFRSLLSPVALTLNIGEGIVQYTDGVLEAMDADANEYGEQRVANLIASMGPHVSAQHIVDGIAADTKKFATSIEDDLTILTLIRRSATASLAPRAESERVVSTARKKIDEDTDFRPLRSIGLSPQVSAALQARKDENATPVPAPVVLSGDPWIGKKLGQVEIVCRISQGSMGLVYRGQHRLLQSAVAVKIMSTQADDEKAALHRERFLREARAAARIRHPNVVQVLDVGETEQGSVYLIMELVEGPNLGRRLDSHGRMGEHELIGVAKGIADGLSAIHQLGIIHRDIKPDNVLMDPLGIAKISDLGLARTVNESEARGLTKTGVVMGTPMYISPEAIRDSASVDVRSDIYSLGVSLYQLLAGRPPFTGKTVSELMRSHLSGEHMPLREILPQANHALCDLIERCLHLDPLKRPTAKQLAQELAQAEQRVIESPTAQNSQGNSVPEFFRRQQRVQAQAWYRRTAVHLTVAGIVGAVILLTVLIANRHWFL
jgi:serine phosphatase RsbU (regulator of sigma subunit)/pSer/pThr/pTyr-binding forkhead associated (FHA) protein